MELQEISASQIPSGVHTVAAELRAAGFRAWVVGGCVRDLLRGAQVADWDLCTTALPAEVMRVFPRVLPTGIQHGTVTVMLEGEGYEVTTLRGEGAYSDGRRPDAVHFVSSIEEDLARRDFTVNAIALDPVSLEIADPWGGVADLRAGILRAVGVPGERFAEDGLRVLRAARFAAMLGSELEEETLAAISQNLDTFRKVSAERVRDEWQKAIERSESPSVAFRLMRQTGILMVVAPLLARYSSRQFASAMYHLDHAPRDFVMGMAAMLLVSEEPAPEIDLWLRELRVSNSDRERITHLAIEVRSSPTQVEMQEWSGAQFREWARRVRRPHLEAACALLAAREPNSLVPILERRNVALTNAALEVRELAITGNDLVAHLNIAPSRALGELLNRLLTAVIEEPGRNQREWLLSHARALHNL